jgi:hypothetical protein
MEMTGRNTKVTATTIGVTALLAIGVAACGGETTATGGAGDAQPDGIDPAPGK